MLDDADDDLQVTNRGLAAVDEEMLRAFVDELLHLITVYEGFCRTIASLADPFFPRGTLEDADRGAAALRTSPNISAVDIDTALRFLRYARVHQRHPLVRIKGKSAPTAAELVVLVTEIAASRWQERREFVRRVPPANVASVLASLAMNFQLECVNYLPSAQELMTLVHTEHAIGLVELAEQKRQNTNQQPAESLESNLRSDAISVSAAGAGPLVEEASTTEAEPLLTVSDWSELAIGVDEKHKLWAVTPVPSVGSRFPKRQAIQLPLGGRRWRKLLELLAESTTGNQADAYAFAAALDILPPSPSLPREPRAEAAALRRGYTENLSMQTPPWKRKLKNTLSDLGRKLRQRVAGPTGQGNLALLVDEESVRSGFVVRYLLRDANGHLTFGSPMA